MSVSEKDIAKALEQIHALKKDQADSEQNAKLKIIEELLKEQLPHEDIDHSAC